MSKPVATKNLWAPIRIGSRQDWILHHYIRYTRRDAKKAYLENYDPKWHKQVLKEVRFARVTVLEQPGEGRG